MSCQSCNSCQTCEGCNSCVSCQSCNSSCNSSGCTTSETYCKVSQTVLTSSDYFTIGSINQGSLIQFSAAKTQSLINKIKTAYREKGGTKTSLCETNNRNAAVGDRITANLFHDIAYDLWNLGGNEAGGETPTITNKTPISESIVTRLKNGVLGMKYEITQCGNCNSGCNVTCKGCQGCNSCQSRNTASSSSSTCADDPKT